MDLNSITKRAKDMMDKRGGTDALKKDAAELKDIARGEGSVTDKAKAAVAAMKDPGARGEDADAVVVDPAGPDVTPTTPPRDPGAPGA